MSVNITFIYNQRTFYQEDVSTEKRTQNVAGVLTETESFWVAGLEYERQDGHDGEETARHDEVDHVIERLAAQSKSECDA